MHGACGWECIRCFAWVDSWRRQKHRRIDGLVSERQRRRRRPSEDLTHGLLLGSHVCVDLVDGSTEARRRTYPIQPVGMLQGCDEGLSQIEWSGTASRDIVGQSGRQSDLFRCGHQLEGLTLWKFASSHRHAVSLTHVLTYLELSQHLDTHPARH